MPAGMKYLCPFSGLRDKMRGMNTTIFPETSEEYSRFSLILDIRDQELYTQGHLPGALCISREALLETEKNSFPALLKEAAGTAASDARLPQEDPAASGKPILVYCTYGILSGEAAEHLREIGYEADHLEGGYGRWLARKILQESEERSRCEEAESSLRKRFKKDITGNFVKAISRYELISPGDHVAVCISGGKDSMLMAKLFQEIKRRNKFPFEVTYLCMDPGYSAATLDMIHANARLLGIPLTMFSSHIFDAVDHIDHSPCYICARMRRGYLYSRAKELGCNKIALGHHYDDVIETTLMSILYSGQVQTMMPKLHSTNFEGMELIRPMYLIREESIKKWRDANGLQFIRCACHFTDTCSIEGKGDSNSKRLEAKHLIADLKKTNPNIEGNLFQSMQNVHLDAVLGYKQNNVRHSFLDSYTL